MRRAQLIALLSMVGVVVYLAVLWSKSPVHIIWDNNRSSMQHRGSIHREIYFVLNYVVVFFANALFGMLSVRRLWARIPAGAWTLPDGPGSIEERHERAVTRMGNLFAWIAASSNIAIAIICTVVFLIQH